LARILVIEHDQYLTRIIAQALLDVGFDVVSVPDSALGVRKVYESWPNMVLFDEKLPPVNGEELCSYISRLFTIPIIALVSSEEGVSAARFLEMGADACLAKPPNWRMLLARVSSLFRRYGTSHKYTSSLGIELDREQHRVSLCDEIIDLTPTEFRLLSCLALNGERVVPYSELAIGVWGSNEISPSGLEFHISSLRKKLAKANNLGVDLCNHRGVGFRFVKQ
jgi:two-component system phosphate regulon response regulator PhoB